MSTQLVTALAPVRHERKTYVLGESFEWKGSETELEDLVGRGVLALDGDAIRRTLPRELAAVQRENESLEAERKALRTRVKELDARVKELEELDAASSAAFAQLREILGIGPDDSVIPAVRALKQSSAAPASAAGESAKAAPKEAAKGKGEGA